MDKKINMETKEIAFSIAELAVQAILYEVSSYPSPGLVSPVSNGAHKDMDYYTFIDSSTSLIKTLVLCAEAGFTDKPYKEIFKDIRTIGIEGEKAMFNKTKGINTHKGMLFLMGITSVAVAKCIYEKKAFSEIQHIIKKLTEGIVDKELKSKVLNENTKDLSHGEKLYLQHKITGIRGEVEQGLPIVFNQGLEIYHSNRVLPINDRIIHTLIGIMQYCEDTTILHRHSIEVLNLVKEKAKYIMTIGAMTTEKGRRGIEELDKEFIAKNISPGGSADLLAVTIFLYEVKIKIFKLKQSKLEEAWIEN